VAGAITVWANAWAKGAGGVPCGQRGRAASLAGKGGEGRPLRALGRESGQRERAERAGRESGQRERAERAAWPVFSQLLGLD
jgi:hypothetical protein